MYVTKGFISLVIVISFVAGFYIGRLVEAEVVESRVRQLQQEGGQTR